VRLLFAAAILVGVAGSARAEHNHMDHQTVRELGVGVALVAASFDTMLYLGNYQGVLPTVQWSRKRYGVAASASVYRIEENGAEYYAPGDVLVHGRFNLVGGPQLSAGAILGVSAPTGDSRHGTGMGHPMVMPALYGVAAFGRLTTNATLGYSRALGGDMDHDHGSWPIVEPMLVSEVSWSFGGDVAIVRAASIGLRFAGGIPAGVSGDARAQAGLRVAWHAGRVESAAEIQAGLAGDPFTVRGVVSTALSF
jgi:hypothetical protein